MAAAPNPSSAKDEKEDIGKTPLGAIILRNEFYRDGYKVLKKIVLLQTLAIVLVAILEIGIIIVYQPENRYFAATEDGRLITLDPLSVPNLSRPALLSWAAQSATETMTFGFSDYRRRLQESSRHFTGIGWKSFTTALVNSGMIEAVTTRRQLLNAAPAAAPTILSEGEVLGVYQWVVEIPMMITYQFGEEKESTPQTLRLTIVRVPRLESANGVGIQQWLAVAGGGD